MQSYIHANNFNIATAACMQHTLLSENHILLLQNR